MIRNNIMEDWTEESLEKFIIENRDKFRTGMSMLSETHEQKFLKKLSIRFKKIINIVPYLIRLSIGWIIIAIISIWLWNSYIRKDRDFITFKQKIERLTFKK